MDNIILKVWLEADMETRVNFIIEMVKRYHYLMCCTLKDMNYCLKQEDKKDD